VSVAAAGGCRAIERVGLRGGLSCLLRRRIRSRGRRQHERALVVDHLRQLLIQLEVDAADDRLEVLDALAQETILLLELLHLIRVAGQQLLPRVLELEPPATLLVADLERIQGHRESTHHRDQPHQVHLVHA
jgi:hypothetical protein